MSEEHECSNCERMQDEIDQMQDGIDELQKYCDDLRNRMLAIQEANEAICTALSRELP